MNNLRKSGGGFKSNHFARYVLVGSTTLVIDMSLLLLIHGVMKVNVSIATTIAFWTSILYNFVLNRWWTFDANRTHQLYKHILAYLVLLGFNYVFTLLFVTIGSSIVPYWVAKILAVGIQIMWTYPIYKFVIFRVENSDIDMVD